MNPTRAFYVRYSDPTEFESILNVGKITYACDDVPYTITVSRYLTKSGSDDKGVCLDLEEYHSISMGHNMGIIGTTPSMEHARTLAGGSLRFSGDRNFVLLYIPY